MIPQERFKRRYTCGQRVSGYGRRKLSRDEANIHDRRLRPSQQEYVIGGGVITKLTSKPGEPYTVLDEGTFVVLEAEEDDLVPLS